jgi:hypothetical protein
MGHLLLQIMPVAVAVAVSTSAVPVMAYVAAPGAVGVLYSVKGAAASCVEQGGIRSRVHKGDP